MRRSMSLIAAMMPALIVGLICLNHFSQNVRTMDFIGLAAGGAACGAALTGIIVALVGRIRSPQDKTLPDNVRSQR
jgi:hypothetical protein